MMEIQYEKVGNQVKGKVTSNYSAIVETKGQVTFKFDQSTSTIKRQHYDDDYFVSTGVIRVYEGGEEFLLNGILEVKPNQVTIHVIDEDLDIDPLIYNRGDQAIRFGGGNKLMRVREGHQSTSANRWQELTFDANLVNFNGVDSSQAPMTYIVTGDVNTENANLKVDNIEVGGGVDLGFGSIQFTYNFQAQSLFGSMDMAVPSPGIVMGPVTVYHILAQIFVDPQGFLFASVLEGTIAGTFDASLSLLLGSHPNIPPEMINTLMDHTHFAELPPSIADRSLNGFYISGQVFLVDAPLARYDFGLGYVEGMAEVGFDARIFMDFDAQGFAFGFGALAYADIGGGGGLWGSPCSICLSASLRLELQATVEQVGNEWDVSGLGCGSLLFTIQVCPIELPTIGGKADILFSTLNGMDVDFAFGEGCGGSTTGGFDCN
jgi:hypothetical protein